jgi:uncharacterized membrane protein YsdA (DUF1294 family)
MGATIWHLTLEISTLLGGLAALVFFYDRFRHLEKRKALRFIAATAAILVTCGVLVLWVWFAYQYGLLQALAVLGGAMGAAASAYEKAMEKKRQTPTQVAEPRRARSPLS